MKVLQLTKYYPPVIGGVESVTFDLTEGLKKFGVNCDVLCANTEAQTVISDTNQPRIWRAGRWAQMMSTAICPRLPFLLRRISNEYKIIHVHFPDPMNALALYLVRPKGKLVIHWHSDIIKQKKALKYFKPLQDWTLKRASLIIGTTPKYIAESQQLSDFRNKAVAIPIGINIDRITSTAEDVMAIQTKYQGKKIIFALGRLVYYKGFEYLIKACVDLPENAVVVIGGEGPMRSELEGLIRELGLENKVFLPGKIDGKKLGSYFEACYFFGMPSTEKAEAVGVAQIEAMACSKPVIATNIYGSGVDWVNEHDVSGFNVPVKDSIALANKIKLLLSDEDKYRKLSQGAKTRFDNWFTVDKMCTSVYQEYTKLLGIDQ